MTIFNSIRCLYSINESENAGFNEIEIAELELRLNIRLPQKLREYYLNLGKIENLNYSHNRLLKPEKEIGVSDDGYLVFYEENQVVVYWGIKKDDLTLDNPPVYGNYFPNGKPDWHLEAKTTEDFLLLMAVYNGTFGGLKYNANSFIPLKKEVVEYIQTNWKEVKEISSEIQKVYTENFDEVISISFDKEHNGTSIFIGTAHQERFDNLLGNLAVDWSYTSYEDEDEGESNEDE